VTRMNLQRRRFLRLMTSAALFPALWRVARAQSYPARPVRIIVGFPAGGPNDFHARLIGHWLSERLGQEFLVENRAGASGVIAMEAFVRAPADGYTLLLISSPDAINATLYKNLPFNFVRDIEPVAGIIRNQFVLVVNPLFSPKSVPQFLAYLRTYPGKVNMASAGEGTPQHLAGELLRILTGLKFLIVPYSGEAPALSDLIGGHVQVMFATITSSLDYIRAGKLYALAATSTMRSDALPGTPIMSDFVPGYDITGWAGIGAPRGTPPEIVKVLNQAINAGLASPAIRARYSSMGAATFAGSSAAFRRFIAEDVQKWATVIRLAKIERK
jgi:tripartite-type tricarboxylate transporter receptor subunit TctC